LEKDFSNYEKKIKEIAEALIEALTLLSAINLAENIMDLVINDFLPVKTFFSVMKFEGSTIKNKLN